MLGDLSAGDTLDFYFTTRAAGVPTTLAGSPAVSVYKADSLSQSTAGITLDVDFDGLTGLNHVRVDTTADGTFYANGNDFACVVTAGTVSGISVVGVAVEDFSLAHRAGVWSVATRTLSAAGVQAIWDALTSALTTVGSIGKLLVDNINATISSRLASASYTTPPTVGAIADQVWDELLSGHAVSGSTGEALSAAGSAGDPWITNLPGSYSGTQAGKIVSDIKTQTDKLTFDVDNALDANIQKINDTELTGDGSTGTPWGPV